MEGEATSLDRPLVWHVSDRSSDLKPGSFQSFAEGPILGSRSSFPLGSVKFFGVRSDLCLSAIGFGYRFYFSDPDHSFFDLHQSTHQMQDGEDRRPIMLSLWRQTESPPRNRERFTAILLTPKLIDNCWHLANINKPY